MSPSVEAALTRADYRYFQQLTTRWIDNDVYGHINNTVYYTWFDTVTASFLIEKGGLDFQHAQVVGFIVASSCQYRRPIAYPELVDAGFRVNRLSNRSVEYGIGIFREAEEEVAAFGTFTHVFVDRASGKAVAIPTPIRDALASVLKGT